MKTYIKCDKCAISSPMHTSVCISFLELPVGITNMKKTITISNVLYIDLLNPLPDVCKQFCLYTYFRFAYFLISYNWKYLQTHLKTIISILDKHKSQLSELS